MGCLCARKLGVPFYDSDAIMANDLPEGCADIRSFYRSVGPVAFKRAEAASMKRFLSSSNDAATALCDKFPFTGIRSIVSLGGGACDNEDLMAAVKGRGIVAYLTNDCSVLFNRIIAGGIPPFLDERDPEGSFAKLYAERDARYRSQCDFMIQLPDCERPEETCRFLMKSLSNVLRTYHKEPCHECE